MKILTRRWRWLSAAAAVAVAVSAVLAAVVSTGASATPSRATVAKAGNLGQALGRVFTLHGLAQHAAGNVRGQDPGFLPLLQGSTTGIVVAALWRFRRGRLQGRELGGVATAVLAHIAFALGTQVLTDQQANQLFILVWQALIVGAVLVYIRYLLHHALLEEAAHMGFAETVCPNCHMHIVASGFCPNCGVALTAAPAPVKRARRPRAEAKS